METSEIYTLEEYHEAYPWVISPNSNFVMHTDGPVFSLKINIQRMWFLQQQFPDFLPYRKSLICIPVEAPIYTQKKFKEITYSSIFMLNLGRSSY